uniref:Integrase catalytic domain-containing protein n=1 Tax=Neogobius melanostomus TaxID=47308 RepID=A0A8C6S5A0_9GOBI
MEDQLSDQVLRFYTATEQKYPQWVYDLHPQANAKSKFRQAAKPYRVLTKSRMSNILEACHDNHFGRDKTLANISDHYYWKGMKSDVYQHVKACEKLPGQVWSLVGIDLIGPLQETSNGNKYIVAATDHFSKWTEATALPDKSAKSVAHFLCNVICRLGCMDTLISDQGREFVNSVIDNLMTHFKTDHRISSAYHPQTNGQRVRDNRTLKESLSKHVNDQGNNWDEFLPGVLRALTCAGLSRGTFRAMHDFKP